MTNEIKTQIGVQIWRDNVVIRRSPLVEVSTSTTSELYSDNTQVVGTSHELVAAGDVTDAAMLIVENLHATAIVEIGGDDGGTFVPWLSIPPGGPVAVIPRVSSLAGTYLESDTVDTPVRVTLAKIVAPA